MGKKCKLLKKIYASIYHLTGRKIKPPMDNPGHHRVRLFIGSKKNICFISIHERISKLQTFVYVAVTKEFTDDRFSVNFPSFSNTEACPGGETIPWWMHKFMTNTMSEDSIPYAIVSVSYDGLCKCL